MKEITASQLAVLLDIPRKEAAKKIIVALERKKGNKETNVGIKSEKYDKNPSINIDVMSKYLNMDLSAILKSVRENFLIHPSTGRWILDYPVEKLKPNKDTGNWPRSVKIPETLRSMLSEEIQKQIVSKWQDIYKEYTNRHGVVFK